ncbi:predicted protein [Sclerotinia sclerotiorum 1980 UF-70]|uniref:Uncharacterized protein n=2 Tax=Sclerotinia sclerotiorum (strain ATCC 18683 / 1980 / Ss-1) TaxID=665079 RepID=A7EVS6_SCLS1|nr:predicted protein [Sclerotinia sclerotiorum 1980 UF-70]APA15737.1 hypothetical protein sscle_15g105070 [Sclerotinia sclerotiorum 1980 UF-70]EDN93568.1 predicted protein [Sclerotinia sclerotiorum 1980 UF-70]
MFGVEFLKNSCSACGIDFENLQLPVDELWRAGVFSSSSDLIGLLRGYTDEELGSDGFRKAVGLLPLRKDIFGCDEVEVLGLGDRNRVLEWPGTQERRNQELPDKQIICSGFTAKGTTKRYWV